MRASKLIAIVDDDPGQRQLLDNALTRAGYRTVGCEEGEAGLRVAPDADLMLLDVRMPGLSGFDVMARLQERGDPIPILLLTAYIDVRDAVAAIKRGAVDYLEKPVDLDELIIAVDDALGVERKRGGADAGLSLPPGVVAESAALQLVLSQAARAAATNTAILITGESGVGKQVVAEYIQQSSARAKEPFVTVNGGAFPEHLIGSELFGHEKGAFTDADRLHVGRFEVADGGTLFLDEVGEVPLALQPAFLRVLETGIFQRVGGTVDLHTDVRLIAATNCDLAAAVEAGTFREDLYYRINVFPLHVPPLRERPEDIIPLAEQMLLPYRKRLSPAAARHLMAYDWPGNVRELRNAVERACILSDGRQILVSHLPDSLQHPKAAASSGTGVLVGTMATIQQQAIMEALEKTGGNKTHAAELLGISRRNLVYKLRNYGL